jgi:hypothetical protein
MSYSIIRQAILDRSCLTAIYQNRLRHFSPHAIGKDDDGETHVMAFQYAGQSSRPLPPRGEWRCFEVSKLRNVIRNSDTWHTGFDHGRPNTCVTRIDVQAR